MGLPAHQVTGAQRSERLEDAEARSPEAARRGFRAGARARRRSSRPGPEGPGRRSRLSRPGRSGVVLVSCPPTSTRPEKRPPWKCGTSPARTRRSVDFPSRTGREGRRARPDGSPARRPPEPAGRRPDSGTTEPPSALEPQRPHHDDGNGSHDRHAVEAGPRRGRRPSPAGRPNPRASIDSARLRDRSSEPATSGEMSVRGRARLRRRAHGPERFHVAGGVALGVGTSRVARATASTERRNLPPASRSPSRSSRSA